MARRRSAPRDLIAEALSATRPTRRVEFERAFAPADAGSWCEIIKDVVALANSGGGVVVVGVEKDGRPSGSDPGSLLAVETAEVVNGIATYTGEQFDEVDIREAERAGHKVALLVVGTRTGSPLVFEKAGTYADGSGRRTTAFARGTVYFRHGAKSEPAVARDLARFASNEATRIRRDLLRNVRKVSSAPSGSEVIVVPPKSGPAASLERFRVVDDPSAPALARTDYDVTHPFRQKELLKTINDRVGRHVAGPYEIQCVRRVYAIDARPEFFHRPKFGSPQYSDAFVSWLVTEYQADPEFFEKAKEADRAR